MAIETLSELANIAGKYLKAEQLKLAREIFGSERSRLTQAQGIARELALVAK